MATPALIVREGAAAGHRLDVIGEVVLGRTESDFLQHDSEISRRHAAIRATEAGLEIEDLGSSNGTFVNESRIEEVRGLSHGDTVRVGQTTFDVELPPGTQATTTSAIPTGAPDTQVAPRPATPEPVLPATPPPIEPAAPAPAAEEPTAPPAAYQPQPPAGPPAFGQPPAQQPPPYAGYAAPTGVRPGAVIGAGIILIVAGLLAGAYYVLFGLTLVQVLSFIGFNGQVALFFIVGLVNLVFCVLAIVTGARVLGRTRPGRGSVLGLTWTFAALGLGFVVFVLATGGQFQILDILGVTVQIGGGLAAGIMLSSASGYFDQPVVGQSW
jgi:pSer/pThr/pTyr-binding forkhead associated (FHA) protein